MDPTINTDRGAPASVQVIEPLVARLEPDPFETDTLSYILTRLQQEHPQLFVEEGGALADLFVKPMVTLLEPLRREFRSVSRQLSLANPEQLTSVEADRLMANFFMTRTLGGYARVKIRIYFQNPLSANIGTTNVGYTANGLRYLPAQAQSINAEEMLFNIDSSGLYYFDVNYQAERPGTAYNIGASQIIGVTGLTAATRATNLAKATPGVREETTAEFIDRGESSMGERSATTFPGMVAALKAEFSDLTIIQAIGFNDEEMHRDVIVGGSLGPVLHSGADGSTSPTAALDNWTTLFDVTVPSIDFTVALGPIGTDLSGYSLEVWYNDGVAIVPHEFILGEVMGAAQLSIASQYDGDTSLPDGVVTPLEGHWTIRTASTITLSDIPGGILFPDVTNGETLTIPSNEIHVGGCADIYVRGGDIEENSLALSLVADEDVIARREDAQTDDASPGVVTLNDLLEVEYDNIVPGRTSLVIEEGTDAGSYRVLEKSWVGPGALVRLSETMTAPGTVTDLSYLLVDDIDIDLTDPREVRFEGEDLLTVAGLPIVETVSAAPTFAAVGVVDTDYVRILEGDDAGEYGIVSSGVSGNQLTIDTIMTTSSSPLGYEIYRKQDGVELPLLRVKTVELLDSNLDPTGAYVPYRHPVDVQSSSFQNPGREAKVGTNVSISQNTYLNAAAADTDTLQMVDEDGVATGEDLYALGVRAGDIVNINTTDNQGYYTVLAVGTHGLLATVDLLQLTSTVRWPTVSPADMEYEIGPPSYGSFRLYFLDPVTFEATYASALLSVELGATSLNFRPDPEVLDEILPSDTATPTAGWAALDVLLAPFELGGAVALDVPLYGVAEGDRLEITYAPLVGSVDLAAGGPYLTLDGATVLIDVGNGTETVTFSGTSLDTDTIIAQINAQLSVAVASKFENPSGPGEFYLMLRADRSITIRSNLGAGSDATDTIFGVARQTWNTWLVDGVFSGGAGPNAETNNDSPEKGFYLISTVFGGATGPISITDLAGTSWTAGALLGGAIIDELGHYLHIERFGRQRITSTTMADQVDENGLYYFDLECISQGYGNLWNIADDLQATVVGYGSEGWEITTEDDDTSYSMAEKPWLGISPRILVVGSDDDPGEKQELSGRSIQIVYERDPIVERVHDYMRDPQNRVLVSSPLAKSLLPIFVRAAIEYRSGGTEDDVRADLVALIDAILPENMLEVDDMANTIRTTGATKVTHPVVLLGIGHQRDRTIITERSVDQISSGRMSALIPDDDGTTSEGASYISLSRSI